MINLTLNQLLSFVAVAETRSFREAAQRLHVSPPAISARIAQLEDALGLRLLERTTRTVSLTGGGQRLLAAAGRSLRDLEAITGELRREASLEGGRVVVAALPSLAATLLPQAMSRFRQAHPTVQLVMRDVYTGRALELLSDGEAALAVLADNPERPDFVFEPLRQDECFAVLPREHRLGSRRSLALRELMSQPLLLPAEGTGLRRTVEDAFRREGLALRPAQEALNLATLLGLTEAGFGITFVPGIFAKRLDLSALRMVPLRPQRIMRVLGVVMRRDGFLQAPAAALLAVLRRELGSVSAQPQRARG